MNFKTTAGVHAHPSASLVSGACPDLALYSPWRVCVCHWPLGPGPLLLVTPLRPTSRRLLVLSSLGSDASWLGRSSGPQLRLIISSISS